MGGGSRLWPGSGRRVAAGVVVLLLLAAPASATTVAPVSLAELSVAADLVVEGWVAAVESRDEPGGIFTYVTLDGLRVLHGSHPSPALKLRFAGGEVAGAAQHIAGMPSFLVGERVLLFVRGNGTRLCPLVGWQQGRFDVVRDPTTGAEYLTDGRGHPVVSVDDREAVRYGKVEEGGRRTAASAGVPDDATPQQRSLAASVPARPLGLDAFLREVARLRATPPAASPGSTGGNAGTVAP